MPASHDNPVSIEKAFTLKFLKPNPSVEIDSDKWSWQPAIRHDALGINTATFSGKNQADDYERE